MLLNITAVNIETEYNGNHEIANKNYNSETVVPKLVLRNYDVTILIVVLHIKNNIKNKNEAIHIMTEFKSRIMMQPCMNIKGRGLLIIKIYVRSIMLIIFKCFTHIHIQRILRMYDIY